MDRRTFMKAAAGTTMLGANPAIAASPDHRTMKSWPETAFFDNPIASRLIPMKFVEELPLVLRGQPWMGRHEAEIFSFTANEWITDAVLFRGMEIKPKNQADLRNRGLLDIKLGLYVDGNKVSDGFSLGDFMKEGGRAFRRWDRSNATKALTCTYLGWSEEWTCSPERFLGYFLPDKTCISVKADGYQEGSIAVEIKCDMARYSTKK